MEKILGAVVAGHICLDIIPEIQALPAGGFNETFLPGHLLEVGPAALSTGGAVSNTGLALHRLGIPTQLICKIGADAFGRIVRELIESECHGLAEGLVVDPQAATSYSMIISPTDVDRIVLHNPAANHTFCADDIDYHLVGQAALFHFGYPPVMRRMYAQNGQGLVDLFRQVKQTGMTTSLDMCHPDLAAEGGQVTGTTGAGDAAIAGFLSALLRGFGPELALTMASAVGACNVEAADALSGLRSWDITLKRIRAGWERLPLRLEDPAWSWDQSDQVWRRNGRSGPGKEWHG